MRTSAPRGVCAALATLPRRAAARAGLRRYSRSPLSVAFKSGDDEEEGAARYRAQKNPKIPPLQGLDKRWAKLSAGEQDDVVAYLEDRMRENWNALSADEKRAAWYVWFGKWGPRGPGGGRDFADLYKYVAGAVGASMAGVAAYKYATFDPAVELKGLDYDRDVGAATATSKK